MSPSFPDLFASLPPYQTKRLLHLLTCNECRQVVVPNLMREQVTGLVPSPEEWSELAAERPAEESPEAAAALADLLGSLPGERAGRLAEERFHKTSLLELLLRSSRNSQLDNPELAEHLASLAGQLATRIPEIQEGKQAAYLTRAAVLEANARRLAGNLKEALAGARDLFRDLFRAAVEKHPPRVGDAPTRVGAHPTAVGVTPTAVGLAPT